MMNFASFQEFQRLVEEARNPRRMVAQRALKSQRGEFQRPTHPLPLLICRDFEWLLRI